jgi:hypothetical protein
LHEKQANKVIKHSMNTFIERKERREERRKKWWKLKVENQKLKV